MEMRLALDVWVEKRSEKYHDCKDTEETCNTCGMKSPPLLWRTCRQAVHLPIQAVPIMRPRDEREG